MFKVNHSEAAGGAFDPIPVGEYEVFITNVEVKKSSTGNDMINATLTVRDDIEQAGKKRKIFDNLVATSAAMWKFQQLFKALGFEDGKEFPGGIAEVAQAIKHQPVRIKNKHETYTTNAGEQKTADRVNYYTVSQVGGRMAVADTSDPFATDSQPGTRFTDDDLPF